MSAILFLLAISSIPIIGVWLCIQIFRWVMKRSTGHDVYISPDGYFDMFKKMKTLWHQNPLDYDSGDVPALRKRKHTPHYDRLIDKHPVVQATDRLQVPPLAEQTTQDEPVTLSSLINHHYTSSDDTK